MIQAEIGIIGGSALYRMPNLNTNENILDTPFSKPADNIVTGKIGG
jgi:5'-methylthioadenosine phosphorylase